MIGMGPYLPAENTPMGSVYDKKLVETNLHTENLFNTCLRMISAMRLTIPRANVSATTALEVLSPDARVEAMRCGSNVVMPVYTPLEQKQKYSLYKGKSNVQSNL